MESTLIDEAFQNISCNRRRQPEEYWCRESVLNYLNLFIDSDRVFSFKKTSKISCKRFG
ncbi:hypothetical protein BDF21DRAFT_407770 [Thamnidium elegans]|nr:hypothetical protein BDF21DRAFT_407770 [Thamnidium elegans]